MSLFGAVADHYVAAGGGGGSIGAWLTAVLTDTPWGAWKYVETTGTTLADSSGNSRSMGVQSGTPTLAQTGPDGGADSILWPSGASAGTTPGIATSAYTVSAWVKISANPAALMHIIGPGRAGTFDKTLYVDTNGIPNFYCYNGSGQKLAGSTALTLNTWHHIAASVGAAGMKIRLDKVTIGTNGVTSSFSSSMSMFAHNSPGVMNGGGNVTNTSAATIGPVAVFSSQLSDARTDAHRDALVP